LKKKKRKLKKINSIIFMGTPDFALPCLEALAGSEYSVKAVVTQPDRPKGRHGVIEYSNIKKYALSKNIPVLQPEKIKKDGWPEKLQEIGCDLFITCAFGQILSKKILDIPVYGTINIHASLLPKYRGASPMQRAIINGDDVTGVTSMLTDIGMDTGDILLMKETGIRRDDTISTLHDRLSVMGSQLLMDTIKLYGQEKITPVMQDDSKSSYAPMIKKEEGLLDFNKSAKELFDLIRAFNPWPGTFTTCNGKEMKVITADYSDDGDHDMCSPGSVICISKECITVKCKKGLLYISQIQFENKKRMTVRECGHNMCSGTVLGK